MVYSHVIPFKVLLRSGPEKKGEGGSALQHIQNLAYLTREECYACDVCNMNISVEVLAAFAIALSVLQDFC